MSDEYLDPAATIYAEKNMENINPLAEQLAKLLQQTDEFKELARLASLIHLDPDVNRLMLQIRRLESTYGETEDGLTVEELQERLQTQPAYQAYVLAEDAVRDLFYTTNKVISAAVGVEFAANARPHTCSCGG